MVSWVCCPVVATVWRPRGWWLSVNVPKCNTMPSPHAQPPSLWHWTLAGAYTDYKRGNNVSYKHYPSKMSCIAIRGLLISLGKLGIQNLFFPRVTAFVDFTMGTANKKGHTQSPNTENTNLQAWGKFWAFGSAMPLHGYKIVKKVLWSWLLWFWSFWLRTQCALSLI